MSEELTAEQAELAALQVSENGVAYRFVAVPDWDSPEAQEITEEKQIKELPTKNIKIRVDITNRRLKEDDETYEEYKYRQSIVNHRINKYLKGGTLVWNSALMGTYDKKRLQELINKQNDEKGTVDK